MRVVALSALLLSLVGCATPLPPMPPAEALFADALFAAPSEPVDADAAMAVSDEMRSYLAARIPKTLRVSDRQQRLLDALYTRDGLRLEYDATMTRTAAQAFAARSGNCLALVMMTGALAKELGLGVRYQVVLGENDWDRAGDIAIAIGHVNLTLDDRTQRTGVVSSRRDPLTVDFLPTRDGRRPTTRTIAENTVIAMYLNNRAVELLTRGRAGDAYWWARESIARDPQLIAAYLTLGVVYRNLGHPERADAVLRRIGEREPDNLQALANHILVLHDLGRDAEAGALQARADRLDPHPPFSEFRRGLAALREHRLEDARRLFEGEADRAPDYHEFQFWLAVTYAEMNDVRQATEHLTRAMQTSTTYRDHDLYAGKLERLKALTARP
jgi:tetratricopeptide (TPR) repeat protein